MKMIYITNVFINYCSSRTLVNSLEMTFMSIALFLYPHFSYVGIISLSFVLRSTTAIFWLPIVLYHVYDLWKKNQISYLFTHMIPLALIILLSTILIDSLIYGNFVFASLNFFTGNIVMDISSFHGVHSFHWYSTNITRVT